jgi:hypothetical protein
LVSLSLGINIRNDLDNRPIIYVLNYVCIILADVDTPVFRGELGFVNVLLGLIKSVRHCLLERS